MPSVVFGSGSIEQAHTKDEFIEIEQLEKAAEVYFQFCANPPSRELDIFCPHSGPYGVERFAL